MVTERSQTNKWVCTVGFPLYEIWENSSQPIAVHNSCQWLPGLEAGDWRGVGKGDDRGNYWVWWTRSSSSLWKYFHRREHRSIITTLYPWNICGLVDVNYNSADLLKNQNNINKKARNEHFGEHFTWEMSIKLNNLVHLLLRTFAKLVIFL